MTNDNQRFQRRAAQVRTTRAAHPASRAVLEILTTITFSFHE
jgi:hypothetical protein